MFKLIFIVSFVTFSVNGVPFDKAENNRRISSRIFGGKPAAQGSVPHMAALLAGEGFTIIACGGSIVNSKLIITAARCIETFVEPDGLHHSFHAVVGATNWYKEGLKVPLENYHIHPEWDFFNDKNDIGFLVTERMVMSDTVKPVPLDFKHIDGVEPSYMAGWGRMQNWPAISPVHLKVLDVDTIPSEQCVAEIKRFSDYFGEERHVDPSIEICTLHSFGKGLCFGDAGGGLISRQSGSLIGIASWIFYCGAGAPEMFTRISPYKDYIQYYMAKYE